MVKRETRENILNLLNSSPLLTPESLTEARQLSAVLLSLLEYPNEFFNPEGMASVDNFYETVTQLVDKISEPILEGKG